ncbi:MAG: hypothetical protein GY751_19045, partial [Bacteroidetes bacterium]|nr:hypothetical protein [Bacteroidota bacterium]
MLSKGETSRREKYDLDKMFDLTSRGEDRALKLAGGGKVRADQLRIGDVLSSGETVSQKLKTGNRARRQIQLMLDKGDQSRREKYDLDKMFDLTSRGEDRSLKLAGGGKVRADQLRIGDVLSSGETVSQKLKTGNRSRRQVQLMLDKGGQSRREKYDLDKMFDLNSRGPDVALKLALGGIATKKKVGAAILDPDQGKAPEGVNVGIKDVKPFITKSTQAQRDGISKEYGSQKYSIVKQGLNQKTSDGFKDTLLDGAAKGVNDAVSSLGTDLGLGSVKPDPSDIGSLKEKIRSSGALGGPFENALNILSNKGKFKPSPANAPFDFPDGLNGAVKDNYDKLPGSYIDAKSSYGAAETDGIKGKIAQEIAAEYKGSATYKNLAADTGSGDKAGLQKALKARFPNRSDRAGYSLSDFQTATGKKYKASELKELGFTKASGTNYLNSGGSAKGPAPSDTVPAMLTPGEFVFSKKAAESIGYGRLNKMNKKGVEGFATGG